MNLRIVYTGLALIGAVLWSSLAARPATAALVTVFNPSFEDDNQADGMFTSNSIVGWTVSPGPVVGLAGAWNPSNAGTQGYPGGVVPDGVHYAYTNGNRISQELSTTLEANTRYTLNVDIGNRNDVAFRGYGIALLADGQVLAVNNNQFVPPAGTFQTATLVFNPGATHALLGQQLTIRLIPSTTGQPGQTNFDNVRLDAVATPEPASMLMGCVALCGFGVAARRRRRLATISAC